MSNQEDPFTANLQIELLKAAGLLKPAMALLGEAYHEIVISNSSLEAELEKNRHHPDVVRQKLADLGLLDLFREKRIAAGLEDAYERALRDALFAAGMMDLDYRYDALSDSWIAPVWSPEDTGCRDEE